MKCLSSLPLGILIISNLAEFSQEGKAPLFFEKEPNNVIAVTGKSATFYCKVVAAGRKITYFWKFNGSSIAENNDNGFKIFNGSLYIFDIVKTRHAGKYECIAFNKDLGAIKSRKAMLQIAYIYRENFIKSRMQFLDTQRPYIIQAPTYRALPAPTFHWKIKKFEDDGTRVYLNSSSDKVLYVTSKGNLLIPSAEARHQTDLKVFVSHPAMAGVDSPMIMLRWTSLWPDYCPNSNLTTFPTVTNKTAYEGSDVFFECFVVAIRCDFVMFVTWVKKTTPETFLNETSRRLVLKNVTKKSHEGIYECQGRINRRRDTLNITYTLNVIEKPKLVKAVKPIVSLPENGILHPAVFDKTASLKWYKDGYVIDKSSTLFDVLPNGNLKMKNPSPALSGIYEMFYENQAGTKTASQTVYVDSRVGCGQKIFKLSGSITYNQDTPTWKDVTCIWIFQLPSAKKMQFKITKFEFRKEAMLSIFEGSTASQSLSAKYSLSVAYVNGPFISMVFITKASNVGSFSVDYWPTSEGPATTVATERSKVQPTTTKSTKQEPVKAKQTGCKGGCNTGAIVGGIFGVLILIALIVLIIYREKVLRKCGRSGSANVKTSEPTLTPMFEVDKSEQTC